MFEKINDIYCDVCVNLYFKILKVLHIGYFDIHNL